MHRHRRREAPCQGSGERGPDDGGVVCRLRASAGASRDVGGRQQLDALAVRADGLAVLERVSDEVDGIGLGRPMPAPSPAGHADGVEQHRDVVRML